MASTTALIQESAPFALFLKFLVLIFSNQIYSPHAALYGATSLVLHLRLIHLHLRRLSVCRCFFICFSVCFLFSVSLLCCYLPSSVPFWFSAVPAFQQTFHSNCQFIGKELLTEVLCYLHRLAWPWNRPCLPLILLESVVNIIACCLVLLNQI
jgi:hypothetical protein